MSAGWAGGSTWRWRKIRLYVLGRDLWVCQLCHKPINPALRPPDPMSACVHHVRGKRFGDDPADLVAAHRGCNQAAGDPTRVADPEPVSSTRWW